MRTRRPIVVTIAVVLLSTGCGLAGEVLYNGIELPEKWPPGDQPMTRDPLPTPPYLMAPPKVIPIDVGRQLFVDDFLIESTTLERSYHLAEYYPDNPVLQPDRPWECNGQHGSVIYSDGVWHDPADKLFKAWYLAPYSPPRSTCYATSRDGIHWDKPTLDVTPGANAVVPDEKGLYRDSATVWLDLFEKDPARRFKMWRVMIDEREVDGKRRWRKWTKIHFSPDGVHWTLAGESDPCGDRSTVFYNPFRQVWVYSLREGRKAVGRCRAYHECRDVLRGAKWLDKDGRRQWVLWVSADRLDPPRDDLRVPPQLYNLDCVAYESLMLGLFTIWRGQPTDRAKPNEVCVGFSRDGFHWTRPDRRAFIPVSERHGDWNWGNVQSAGGCCLVVGDKLYFYVSGRAGIKGTKGSGRCATGLATLRRDGFASMDAGERPGTLTTRPVRFGGKHLLVNAAVPDGELRVEVLDADGRPIAPFTRENCLPTRSDRTLCGVHWKSAGDLSELAGKPVRFRFHLRNGRLYAFWVTPDASGASHGYVAAGGPGFTGPTDTVGAVSHGK